MEEKNVTRAIRPEMFDSVLVIFFWNFSYPATRYAEKVAYAHTYTLTKQESLVPNIGKICSADLSNHQRPTDALSILL